MCSYIYVETYMIYKTGFRRKSADLFELVSQKSTLGAQTTTLFSNILRLGMMEWIQSSGIVIKLFPIISINAPVMYY